MQLYFLVLFFINYCTVLQSLLKCSCGANIPAIVDCLNCIGIISKRQSLIFTLTLLRIQCIIAFPCHIVETAAKANVTSTHMRNETFVARNWWNLFQTLPTC